MSGPTQTLYIQSQKMLASTVQFSTYIQTPVTRPHRTHALPRETQRYEEQTGPASPRQPARSTPTPGQAREQVVLDAGHQGGQVLYVDDSTSEHPSAARANA